MECSLPSTGTAPNRKFVHRVPQCAYYPGNPTPQLDYEVILYETPPSPGRYDVAYQLVAPHTGGTDSALTVGVQQNTTNFTQVGCDPTGTNPPAGVASGAYFIYTLTTCGTPTTPTPTPTATAGTPSPTPTCTAGGTPGPWTQAAPVAVDHYGGFMDSDGTVAYEGGGYSFSVGDNTNQFGKFNPVANTWTPLRRCRICSTPRPQACMRPM